MLNKLRNFLKKIYYSGYSFHCVYCKSNLRILKPHGLELDVLVKYDVIGGKRRDNNKCPICGSNDRERLLYFYYENVLKPLIKEKVKLLHIAPESQFGRVLKQNSLIEYFSGDKFEVGYENSYKAEFIDICDTKLPSNEFDILICNHVLEHVENYNVALAEIKRILQPGGRAILQVPIAKLLSKTIEDTKITTFKEREEKFGQYDHVRLFGQDYSQILESAGFKVKQYTSSVLSDGQTTKFALNPDEILFEVEK